MKTQPCRQTQQIVESEAARDERKAKISTTSHATQTPGPPVKIPRRVEMLLKIQNAKSFTRFVSIIRVSYLRARTQADLGAETAKNSHNQARRVVKIKYRRKSIG
jgi:hypothetical protein